MDRIDRDALERAIVACRAQDAGSAKQIDHMLLDRPWELVARFAAYSAQMDALGLMPWQSPPCQASLAALHEPFGDARARESAEVLRRLLDAGLSPFEPDPLAAIAEAEQRQAAK
jgi:hypothetical protein